MFLSVLSNFLIAIAWVLDYVLWLYIWIMIASIILSWINPAPYNPIVRSIIHAIHSVTEPVFYQVRKRIPIHFGGLDFSPVIIFLIIRFVQIFVVQSLLDVASKMKAY